MEKSLIRIILITFLGFTFCTSTNRKSMPNKPFLIEPGVGVGSLIINSTSKREVIKDLGKGNRVKYPSSFSNHTIYVTKYVYPEMGIELEYSNLTSPKDSDVLSLIRITPTCKFETIEGIGIGTTRLKIENLWGKPKASKYTKLINGIYHSIRYKGIEFSFNDSIESDSMVGTVKQIILFAEK
jgi:hypothetical protein